MIYFEASIVAIIMDVKATALEDAPTISYRALARARTTIEDFTLSYFPLHGLEVPKDFFRWWDLLVYVEATIYAMDEHNEDAAQAMVLTATVTNNAAASADAALGPGQPQQQEERGNDDSTQAQQQQQQREAAAEPQNLSLGERCLVHVLQSKGLWDDRIKHELQQGLSYWRMERRLCSAMAAPPRAGGPCSLLEAHPTPGLDPASVLAAHEAKSFDYRVLHLMLHRLVHKKRMRRLKRERRRLGGRSGGVPRGGGASGAPQGHHSDEDGEEEAGAAAAAGLGTRHGAEHGTDQQGQQALEGQQQQQQAFEYDERLLAFLKVDELLVDIGDDLTDYEDDVMRNSFNLYRAYLHLYGPRAQLLLADRIGGLERELGRLKAGLPRWQRDAYEARQREAASQPGAEKWQFPAPIWDEAAFRAEFGGSNASDGGSTSSSSSSR